MCCGRDCCELSIPLGVVRKERSEGFGLRRSCARLNLTYILTSVKFC